MNDDLPVDDGGAPGKPGRCCRDARVAVGPVETVSGVRAGSPALDDQNCAASIVLDFMDPSSTRWRFVDCGCELRLDELQRHATGLAETPGIASPKEKAPTR